MPFEDTLRVPDPDDSSELRTASLRERMEHYGVPGVSAAVIADGEIVDARGFGVREAGRGDSVAPDTRFQAASISKSVAALAALRLVDAGELELDRDVNEILRSWRVPADAGLEGAIVTIRGLVSHTAGLTVHGFPGYAVDAERPTLLQILDGVPPANTPAVRVDILPGTEFRYSGGGYCVLQQVLLDTVNKPFPEIVGDLVLEPLGMDHSSFEQPLPEAMRDRAATGHTGDMNPIPGRWHVYPEMAAAGLWTTPSDLCRFALALHHARQGSPSAVLSRELAHQMFTRQVDGGMGLGIALDGPDTALRFGHGGSNEGFRCEVTAYADLPCGAAVMTNASSGSAVVAEVLGAIAAQYGWPSAGGAPAPARIDPSVYDEYAGEYDVEGLGIVTVTRRSRALYVTSPWGTIQLIPESPTTYHSTAVPGSFEFLRGDTGDVSEIDYRGGPFELRGRRRA